MPAGYIPLLLFSMLVLSFSAITLIVIKYIRPGSSRGGPAKFQPYDSGIPPETVARGRYFERFYSIVVLSVVLEAETTFLFPWPVLFRSWLAAHLAAFALFSLFVFLGILLVGYVWLYKKGALDVS
jgi:NADH-quinone oxidoreductase subunit A